MHATTWRGLAVTLLFTLLATLFVLPGRVLAATSDSASVTMQVEHYFWVMLAEEGGDGFAGAHHDSPVLHELSNTPFELGPAEMEAAEGNGGFTPWLDHGWLHGWGNGNGTVFLTYVSMSDDSFHDYGIHLWVTIDNQSSYFRHLSPTPQDWWSSNDPHSMNYIRWRLGPSELTGGTGGVSTHTPFTPPGGLLETVTVTIGPG